MASIDLSKFAHGADKPKYKVGTFSLYRETMEKLYMEISSRQFRLNIFVYLLYEFDY